MKTKSLVVSDGINGGNNKKIQCLTKVEVMAYLLSMIIVSACVLCTYDDTDGCMVWSMFLVLYPSSAYERVSEYTVGRLSSAQAESAKTGVTTGRFCFGNISMEGFLQVHLVHKYYNWLHSIAAFGPYLERRGYGLRFTFLEEVNDLEHGPRQLLPPYL